MEVHALPPLRITGFRITRTLDRLVYDLLSILRDTLSDPKVDLLKSQNDVEHLETRILVLLSQPLYVKCLLWRDYEKLSKEEKSSRKDRIKKLNMDKNSFHQEAIGYFYKVLRRRLGLAQNLRERPSSMHQLLQAGCRLGPMESGWPKATIRRDLELSPLYPETVPFQRTIEALEQQHREWAQEQDTDTDTDIVTRRHAEFGPLWLIVADCVAEVIAKLSLFHDVLRALPTPLPAEFAEDVEFQRRFQAVVQSLNERYGVLRSCGLNPNHWFDSEALSIGVLEDIKKLRRCVTQYWKEQPDKECHMAYGHCFDALKLKSGKTKFAGCRNFNEFLGTEIGSKLVWGGHARIDPASLDDNKSKDGNESEVIPYFDPDDFGDEPSHEEAEGYIAACPELAGDALMSMVIRVVFSGCSLDEPKTLAKLRQLIDQNDLHKKKFGALTDQLLTRALCKQAHQIVERHQQQINQKSLS